MYQLNPILEFKITPKHAMVAAAGAGLIGLTAGAIYDYYSHNKKIAQIAEKMYTDYLVEHRNDYSNKECTNYAVNCITEYVNKVAECNELIRQKQTEIHDLQQRLGFASINNNMDRDEKRKIEFKIDQLTTDVKMLQRAAATARAKMIQMKAYLQSKNYPVIRKMLVEADAENYVAQWVSKHTQIKGKVMGFFGGVTVASIAAIICYLCSKKH